MDKIRALFEAWALQNLWDSVASELEMFHEEDGYANQTLNAAWLAFNAGIEAFPEV